MPVEAFIDTNILLDFYRKPGESAIRQLKALEKHRESLILGDQLSMEFLKNRQAAIVAGMFKSSSAAETSAGHVEARLALAKSSAPESRLRAA